MPVTVSDVSATLVASTTRRAECFWNTRCCSPEASRAYSGSSSTPGGRRPGRGAGEAPHAGGQGAAAGCGGVPDLAPAGEEDEHVAGAFSLQLVDGGGDRVGLVLVLGRPVGAHRRRL